MNPPDVYDADGHPYDRRHETRRDDDPSADVTRGAELWARTIILHRGKLIALAVAAATEGIPYEVAFPAPAVLMPAQ